MNQNKKMRIILSLSHNLVLAGFFGVLLAINAVTALPVLAANSDLARWYSSDEELENGKIVSIDPEKGDFVSSAQSTSKARLLGVVVKDGDALLSVNRKEGGVQVAIAGRTEAEVSMVNGPISRGDLIGLSTTPGVGAKAESGQPVVGVAEASFGEEGNAKSSNSGLIPILVSVGVAPSALGAFDSASATWVRSIAGNDVSALQLAFVFFIAAIGIISIVVLTYSSTRNGLAAVGRNPLAKPSILRALSQAMIMVSVVAISCVSLMYFMLRL